jgi:hypothetical protein
MTLKNKSYEIECGEFIVRIPAKYKVFWTELYSLQIGTQVHALYRDQKDCRIRPRDPKLQLSKSQLETAKYEGRYFHFEMGRFEMLISGAYFEKGGDNAFADFIFDAKERGVKPCLIEVNGIKGFYSGRYFKGKSAKEWFFKKDSTILSITLRGDGVLSRNTKADIESKFGVLIICLILSKENSNSRKKRICWSLTNSFS